MATTDTNIAAFLDALKAYYKADGERLGGVKCAYLAFPALLESDDIAFSRNAETQYMDVLRSANDDQSPLELLTRGNSFYYIKSLCKAHRLYRRDRVTEAMLNMGYSKAMGVDERVTSIDNMQQVGTAVNPILGPKEAS